MSDAVKLCECGCGGAAPIAKATIPRIGHIKGQPIRFICGHHSRKHRLDPTVKTVKLCECGCGTPTRLAPQTRSARGWIFGQPLRFCGGHQARASGVLPLMVQRRKERRPSLAIRFWNKVQKGEGCWEWQGSTQTFGYGVVSDGKQRRPHSAHRLAWELTHGPITDGLWVLHRCDNPPCVRPDHLFLGTPQDNSSDMVNKGRMRTGERSPSSKLTESIVRAVRERHAAGETQESIALDYGVTRAAIGYIVRGDTWKTVR